MVTAIPGSRSKQKVSVALGIERAISGCRWTSYPLAGLVWLCVQGDEHTGKLQQVAGGLAV